MQNNYAKKYGGVSSFDRGLGQSSISVCVVATYKKSAKKINANNNFAATDVAIAA